MDKKQRDKKLKELIGLEEFESLSTEEQEVLLASYEADLESEEKISEESQNAVFAHLGSSKTAPGRHEGFMRLYFSLGSAAAVAAFFLLFFPIEKVEIKEKPVTKKEYITVVDTVEETVRDTVYIDRIRYLDRPRKNSSVVVNQSDVTSYQTTSSVIPVTDVSTIEDRSYGRSLANDPQQLNVDLPGGMDIIRVD